jgi:hypothetical protein
MEQLKNLLINKYQEGVQGDIESAIPKKSIYPSLGTMSQPYYDSDLTDEEWLQIEPLLPLRSRSANCVRLACVRD